MKSPALVALLAAWRNRAEQLAAYAPPAAEAFRTAARELEETTRAQDDELLNLRQASAESGLTDRTLRQHIADGKLINRGRRGAPKVRRGDLAQRAPTSTPSSYSPTADALELMRGAR